MSHLPSAALVPSVENIAYARLCAGVARPMSMLMLMLTPSLVAATTPGRPVKYVKDFVKREYNPLARKGPWKKEEDELLRR